MTYINRDTLLEIIADKNRNTCNGSMTCLQIKRMVENLPTADVAPKSEIERLKAEIRGYDVAKKHDAEHFMADIRKLKAENATLITQRDKLLQSYAKGIFEEIASCLDYIEEQLDDIPDCFLCAKEDIAKLKKKYTEEGEIQK